MAHRRPNSGSFKPAPEEHRRVMVETYLAGASMEAAGAICGLSSSACRHALIAAGVPSRPKTPLSAQKAMADAYAAGASIEEAAGLAGLSRTACRTACKNLGIPFRHHGPSQDERQEIASRYAVGENAYALADEFQVSPQAVYGVCRRLGVPVRSNAVANRRYVLNEHAFDRETTAAKYWAGFLLADGCVYKKDKCSPAVLVTLAAADAEHLETFRIFLESDAPVRIYPAPPPSYKTIAKNGGPSARFQVISGHMAETLACYGVVPRKSLRATAPDHLAMDADFMRGCVDGDGWVVPFKRRSNTVPKVGLCGSRALVLQFWRFTLAFSPLMRAVPHQRSEQGLWSFQTQGVHAMPALRAMYGHDGPALARKAVVVSHFISTDWQPLRAPRSL